MPELVYSAMTLSRLQRVRCFRDTFRDLGDSISDAGQQLSEWLRRARDGAG